MGWRALLHCRPSTRAVIQTPVSGLLPWPSNPRAGAGAELPSPGLCAPPAGLAADGRGETPSPGAERRAEAASPQSAPPSAPPQKSCKVTPPRLEAQSVGRSPWRTQAFCFSPSKAGAAWPQRAPTAASRTALAPKGPRLAVPKLGSPAMPVSSKGSEVPGLEKERAAHGRRGLLRPSHCTPALQAMLAGGPRGGMGPEGSPQRTGGRPQSCVLTGLPPPALRTQWGASIPGLAFTRSRTAWTSSLQNREK